MGVAALVLGLIGLVIALIPLLGFVEIILGILALVFGLVGVGRARKGVATNKVMSWFGAVLGACAIALGIVGLFIVNEKPSISWSGTSTRSGRCQPPADRPMIQGGPVRRAPFLLAFVLALVGCATQGGEPVAGDPPRGTNAPTVTVTVTADAEVEPEAEDSPTPTPSPTTSGSTYSGFGDTYAWTDGLTVTIGPPTAFDPSEYAVIDGAAAHLAFAVTIVNGSSAEYDPNQFYLTAQSGNVEAERVFDPEQDLAGSPSTVLLPGREAVFTIGFGVADPADIVMQVRPSFQYDPAIFTS